MEPQAVVKYGSNVDGLFKTCNNTHLSNDNHLTLGIVRLDGSGTTVWGTLNWQGNLHEDWNWF